MSTIQPLAARKHPILWLVDAQMLDELFDPCPAAVCREVRVAVHHPAANLAPAAIQAHV